MESKTLEELVQEEKDLIAQREKLIKERDSHKATLQVLNNKEAMLAKLVSTLDARTAAQVKSLNETQIKEEGKTVTERKENEQRLAEKEIDLKGAMGPRDEAETQLDIVNKKIELLRERWDTDRAAIMRQIAQARYSRQLLDVRSREIQRRIDAMKVFLREKHPQVSVEEDPVDSSQKAMRVSKWLNTQDIQLRKRRKEKLEQDCRRLMEEKAVLRSKVKLGTPTDK